jgi:hypothetical protein
MAGLSPPTAANRISLRSRRGPSLGEPRDRMLSRNGSMARSATIRGMTCLGITRVTGVVAPSDYHRYPDFTGGGLVVFFR